MQDRYQDLQRIVGFFEYAQALHHFEQLFRATTEDELAAIDEIVEDRPELTIYSGLSLRFPNAARSSLAEGWSVGSDLTRKGVHWLSALARLELAAMLAGHLPRRAAIPAQLSPNAHERSAYLELLRDALLSHASSIGTTPEGAASRPITKSDVLMYERRILQAERITQLLYQLDRENLTPQQLVELRAIQRRLTQIGESVRDFLAIGSR